MKNINSFKYLLIISVCIFFSCETDAKYEVTDRLTSLKVSIPFLENNTARYRIDFGDIQVTDSLPFIDNFSRLISNKAVFIKEKNLVKDLKIWRKNADGSETFESSNLVNASKEIQLLQLIDKSKLVIFNPINPNENNKTQIATQFFYADNLQPNQINISIIAVDFYALLLAFNNPNNVATNKKIEIKNFTLEKSKLSEIIFLDLDLFKQVNGINTVYLYKITDIETGSILQNYGVDNVSVSNSKIEIPANNNLYPKYKYTLFRLKHNSTLIPYKSNSLIVGNLW